MNVLEDVPFQTLLGPLEEDVQPLMAPNIVVPDGPRILQETEYGFNLERWILSRQQPAFLTPSCPPYSLMFSSPEQSRRAGHRSSEARGPLPSRPRSHSLNSADVRRLRCRNIKFRISDHEEDGYSEDTEGSSTEDAPRRSKSRERPRSAASRDPTTRPKDQQLLCPAALHSSPDSPPVLRGQRGFSSLPDCRQPLRSLEQHRSPLASPVQHGLQTFKKRPRPLTSGSRKYSQNTPPAAAGGRSPARLQQRPSSAGPAVKNSRKVLGGRPRGVFFDSAAELLSALSQEERELLETIMERGYPLRTAVLALQKTGYRSPEKVLKYLVASARLCELGYDEAQVEEALEMFQNCESKAAEFLRLLAQFNEMGFQQSAIKEVLLVHENHREKALEELMMRMA